LVQRSCDLHNIGWGDATCELWQVPLEVVAHTATGWGTLTTEMGLHNNRQRCAQRDGHLHSIEVVACSVEAAQHHRLWLAQHGFVAQATTGCSTLTTGDGAAQWLVHDEHNRDCGWRNITLQQLNTGWSMLQFCVGPARLSLVILNTVFHFHLTRYRPVNPAH